MLPRYGYCTHEHLQKVLGKVKGVISRANCASINIPLWPELAIKRIWPLVKDRPKFKFLMPDEYYPDAERVDRDYVWDVISFLYPVWTTTVIEDVRVAREERRQAKLEAGLEIKEDCDLDDEWVDALLKLGQTFKPRKYNYV